MLATVAEAIEPRFLHLLRRNGSLYMMAQNKSRCYLFVRLCILTTILDCSDFQVDNVGVTFFVTLI